MKIILSRKGFDSSAGGQPSPILPDGTLLSLPIPDTVRTADTYSSISWKGKSYYEIIEELKPRTKIQKDDYCHLDPDLRENVKSRPNGWTPAFGQMGAALSALRNNSVGIGDLFLFFGWFKETEYTKGKLRYKKGAPNIHVIFGYLQVGNIYEKEELVPNTLIEHPHMQESYDENWEKHNNIIITPSKNLSFMPDKKGADVLNFRKDRVLTNEGFSRGRWNLPDCFKDVKIAYNPNPWKDGYFQSAGRGQEFIMNSTPQIIDWAKNIIKD